MNTRDTEGTGQMRRICLLGERRAIIWNLSVSSEKLKIIVNINDFYKDNHEFPATLLTFINTYSEVMNEKFMGQHHTVLKILKTL